MKALIEAMKLHLAALEELIEDNPRAMHALGKLAADMERLDIEQEHAELLKKVSDFFATPDAEDEDEPEADSADENELPPELKEILSHLAGLPHPAFGTGHVVISVRRSGSGESDTPA